MVKKQENPLQLAFFEIIENKKEAKDLKALLADTLKDNDKYQEIVEQIKELNEKRKNMLLAIKNTIAKPMEKLEELNIEKKSTKEVMTDLALNSFMKGETVEVEDEFGNKYEPVWTVTFKKKN